MLWVISAVLWASGCGPQQATATEELGPASADSRLAHRKVWLESAQAVYIGGARVYPAWLKGTIGVANLAYDKQVSVVYEVRTPQRVIQDWTALDAHWAAGDRWEFQTPSFNGECPHYCSEISFRFALAYTVDGHTYWDNNDGRNYGVTVDLSPVPGGTETPPGIFAPGTPLQLSSARWSGDDNQWAGEVLVGNVGGMSKSLTLVYSTDDWQTVQYAPVQYMSTSHWTYFEHWRFNVSLPAAASSLVYALRLNTGEQTFWDNNLSRNYRLQKQQ